MYTCTLDIMTLHVYPHRPPVSLSHIFRAESLPTDAILCTNTHTNSDTNNMGTVYKKTECLTSVLQSCHGDCKTCNFGHSLSDLCTLVKAFFLFSYPKPGQGDRGNEEMGYTRTHGQQLEPKYVCMFCDHTLQFCEVNIPLNVLGNWTGL